MINRTFTGYAVACLFWLTSIITSSSNAIAETAFVDPMPKWALAGAFGTPRLYLKSLLGERPRGAAQVVGRLGDSLGSGPIDFELQA